ncbi:sec-independent translocase [Fulvimarina pelagi HTCC2506]|uniref:Sec-independent protein translocase protein TatB n=2 Tax=Fulvimarina pelagi TaxID=217511 RepID=Q0FZP2_9HYPH|nr:Sec-independent protein translocase protein TatB [Fulvimarina pelagi]EAU40549.1 sec-independent translocase [Fulvimarina pelagi HTCC2506]BAT31572.1 sec-independent translocase [Fulvimarina pelagi]
MFPDIGWTEMMVVAVVLIVVVGPKDLPGMLRTFGRAMKQMRSMAGDFRKQFDEALKEAELDEVKKTVDDVRGLNPRKHVRDAMKPMKEIGDDIRSSVKSATKMADDHVETADRKPNADSPAKSAATSPAKGESAESKQPSGAVAESKDSTEGNSMERTS